MAESRLFNRGLREFDFISDETHVTPAEKKVGSGIRLTIPTSFT